MADKFRGHHIVCTSLYEGKGYSGAFCENMTAVVERLRKDPDEELLLVAEPDMICANCPNRTETNECVHNHNRVVNKDRRVIEFFGLEENRVYTDVQTRTRGDEHGFLYGELWKMRLAQAGALQVRRSARTARPLYRERIGDRKAPSHEALISMSDRIGD